MSRDWHEIPLTRGQVALVSAVDWSSIGQLSWRAIPSGSKWYAATNVVNPEQNQSNSRYKTVLLHRLITGAPAGCRVKHLNGNTLDCRRENLEVLLHRGFRGYIWSIEKRGWKVEVRQKGQRKVIGYFDDEYEAAIEHDLAALKLVGKDANLNLPMDVLKEAKKRRK